MLLQLVAQLLSGVDKLLFEKKNNLIVYVTISVSV